jgi:hypothetical protein
MDQGKTGSTKHEHEALKKQLKVDPLGQGDGGKDYNTETSARAMNKND